MAKRKHPKSTDQDVAKKPKIHEIVGNAINNNIPNQSTKIRNDRLNYQRSLLRSMENPIYFITSDKLVTVIKDAFPKAEYHFLVLPNEDIGNLKGLNKEHLSLVEHMEEMAKIIVQPYRHRKFMMGYHAQPSMYRLHLHVISDDMNSNHMRTMRHWNGFISKFFIKSEDVREQLEVFGKVTLPSKKECKMFRLQPLKCHKCKYLPLHMFDLKKHILTHL